MMTPYSGYTKELQPTADRAMTLLLEDVGKGNQSTSWEMEWSNSNYDIKKIGFLKNKETNLLSVQKINVLMDSSSGGGKWWEFPYSTTNENELDNASRALGIGRYNFYIQIRPINESITDKFAADNSAVQMVGDRGDVSSVVRYSIMQENKLGLFDGANLFGFDTPTKPLFGLDKANFSLITENGGLSFTIVNWTIIDNQDSGSVQNIAIGDTLSKTQFKLDKNEYLEGDQFNISLNGEVHTNVGQNGNIRKLFITHTNDSVTIYIPIETFNEEFGDDWWISNEFVYFALNIKHLEVQNDGVTWLWGNVETNTYPVKTILWVW